MFLLALVLPAVAKPACEGVWVADVVPSQGATGVPVDVRPAAIFGSDGCGGDGILTFALLRTADASEVASVDIDTDGVTDGELLALELPTSLDPDTPYQLALGYTTVDFTTGTDTVAGLDGVPALLDANASFHRDTHYVQGGVTLDWTVDPVPDPDGLSILEISDANSDRPASAARIGSAITSGELFWAGDRSPKVCPQVRQIDGAGHATAMSEPLCVPMGCAAVGGPASGWLVGVGVVVAEVVAGRTARTRPSPTPPRTPR
jgi:hypothetical protein